MKKSDLHDIAYYFTAEYYSQDIIPQYKPHLEAEIELWKKHYSDAYLLYLDFGDRCLVFDGRSSGEARVYMLQGAARIIFIRCRDIQSINALRADLGAKQADRVVEILEAANLVVQEEGCLLSLALDGTRCSELPSSAGEWVERFAAADELGRTSIKVECLAV
jgi:hypothetical protein